MNINEITTNAEDVCETLSLLANKSRLMILCQLTEGEKSVGDLAGAIGARETAVSQQLAIMRRERIVKARRDGQTMFYRIIREDIGDLLEFLHATYCGTAAAPKETDK